MQNIQISIEDKVSLGSNIDISLFLLPRRCHIIVEYLWVMGYRDDVKNIIRTGRAKLVAVVSEQITSE